MDLESLKDRAEQAVGKAGEMVSSVVKDEAKTDSALDAVADVAKKVTGGAFDDKIDAARDVVDDKIGE